MPPLAIPAVCIARYANALVKMLMRAATVVQVLQDLFYVLLHVLFYLCSLLYRPLYSGRDYVGTIPCPQIWGNEVWWRCRGTVVQNWSGTVSRATEQLLSWSWTFKKKLPVLVTIVAVMLQIPWGMILPKISKIGWHLTYHKHKKDEVFPWQCRIRISK